MEEGDEQDEKAAALEALLEQFREPEAPRKKASPVWLMLALVLGVAGCWLAAKATQGSILGTNASATEGPPLKPTKVADRSLARNSPKFATETYLERCRKGLSPRQVMWIVGDFQDMGLDEHRMEHLWQLVGDFNEVATYEKGLGWMDPQTPRLAKEEAMEIGWHQRMWYLDALADALSLDSRQRKQARERCTLRMVETEVEFLQRGKDGEKLHPIGEPPPYADLVEPNYWLQDEEMAPWNLADLSEAQLRITWYKDVMQSRNPPAGSALRDPDLPWFDPHTTSRLETSGADLLAGDFPTGEAPTEIEGAGAVFPFIEGQDFAKRRNLASQVTTCHPAQLKMLLLLRPELAADLAADFEASDE